MRWWVRLAITLILAPVLWRLGLVYLAAEQLGEAWSVLGRQSIAILAGVYLTFTLPALVLCGAILTIADVALHKLGLDLLTLIVSPLLAWLVVALIFHVVPQARIQNADAAIVLAIVYGLVWGLTIREPRHRTTATADARPTGASEVETRAAGMPSA